MSGTTGYQGSHARVNTALGVVCGVLLGVVATLTVLGWSGSDVWLRVARLPGASAAALSPGRTSVVIVSAESRPHSDASATGHNLDKAHEQGDEAAPQAGAQGGNAAAEAGAPTQIRPPAQARSKACSPRRFKGRPTGDCGCGWQEQYAELHRKIRSGEAAQRHAAVFCNEGLADCVKAIVSVFYFSLLTRRAFSVHLETRGGDEVRLEWAMVQPNVNWTFPWDPTTAGSHNLSISTSYQDYIWPRGSDLKPMWAEEDVRLRGADKELVYFEFCEPAGWFALLDNPHHKDELAAKGVRPDNIVSCALEFLFEPQQALLDEFKPELEVLKDTAALKIGIQVRHGDDGVKGLSGSNATFDQYRAVFGCAEEVNRTRNPDGRKKLLFYLMSDSMVLRRNVLAHYGGATLVTATKGVEVAHTSRMGADEQHRRRAMLTAAGEMWLFGFTNFQVVSKHSGYGLLGAMWSHTWHARYTVTANNVRKVEHGVPWGGVPRSCGLHDWDREHLWLDSDE